MISVIVFAFLTMQNQALSQNMSQTKTMRVYNVLGVSFDVCSQNSCSQRRAEDSSENSEGSCGCQTKGTTASRDCLKLGTCCHDVFIQGQETDTGKDSFQLYMIVFFCFKPEGWNLTVAPFRRGWYKLTNWVGKGFVENVFLHSEIDNSGG